MSTFEFTVAVECDTLQQAVKVMSERIYHDEDYGFDYTVDYESTTTTEGERDV